MASRVDRDLAEELGVSAVLVQTTASKLLSPGLHVTFYPVTGGRLKKEYTDEGLSLLRSALGSAREKGPPLPHPEPEKPASAMQGPTAPLLLMPPKEPAPRPISTLRIIRIFPNPIWVLVQTPDNRTAEVQVRHSRLLVAGKGLRCAPKEDGGWECADPMLTLNPIYR